jgi:hypothetical protein
MQCFTNYPSGEAYGNPNITDIYKIWTKDLTACITQCASYNAGVSKTVSSSTQYCRAVTIMKLEGEFAI